MDQTAPLRCDGGEPLRLSNNAGGPPATRQRAAVEPLAGMVSQVNSKGWTRARISTVRLPGATGGCGEKIKARRAVHACAPWRQCR